MQGEGGLKLAGNKENNCFPAGNYAVLYAGNCLNPLRYFMIVIREIFIKGAYLNQLYWQGLALVIFSGVIFPLAVFHLVPPVSGGMFCLTLCVLCRYLTLSVT